MQNCGMGRPWLYFDQARPHQDNEDRFQNYLYQLLWVITRLYTVYLFMLINKPRR